jgi:hypothetical protein
VEVLVEMLQLCSLAKSRTTIVVVDTGGNKHFSTWVLIFVSSFANGIEIVFVVLTLPHKIDQVRARTVTCASGIVVTPFARSPYPLHIYFVYVSSGLTMR